MACFTFDLAARGCSTLSLRSAGMSHLTIGQPPMCNEGDTCSYGHKYNEVLSTMVRRKGIS